MECPPAPSLEHFLLCSCRPLSNTFVNSASWGHQATSASHRRGPCRCNTSAPLPVSVRYRPGRDCRRAHESRGLWLGALAPPSSGRLSGPQSAIPHEEGRCPWLGPSSMAAPGCLGHLPVCCPQGDGQGCQRQAVPCRGCLLSPGFLGCCCSWPSSVNPSPVPTHPDPRVQAAINITEHQQASKL